MSELINFFSKIGTHPFNHKKKLSCGGAGSNSRKALLDAPLQSLNSAIQTPPRKRKHADNGPGSEDSSWVAFSRRAGGRSMERQEARCSEGSTAFEDFKSLYRIKAVVSHNHNRISRFKKNSQKTIKPYFKSYNKHIMDPTVYATCKLYE